jgi:hypothetical protein
MTYSKVHVFLYKLFFHICNTTISLCKAMKGSFLDPICMKVLGTFSF